MLTSVCEGPCCAIWGGGGGDNEFGYFSVDVPELIICTIRITC